MITNFLTVQGIVLFVLCGIFCTSRITFLKNKKRKKRKKKRIAQTNQCNKFSNLRAWKWCHCDLELSFTQSSPEEWIRALYMAFVYIISLTSFLSHSYHILLIPWFYNSIHLTDSFKDFHILAPYIFLSWPLFFVAGKFNKPFLDSSIAPTLVVGTAFCFLSHSGRWEQLCSVLWLLCLHCLYTCSFSIVSKYKLLAL